MLYILLVLIEGILGVKDKQIHMITTLSMTMKTYRIKKENGEVCGSEGGENREHRSGKSSGGSNASMEFLRMVKN